MAYRRGRAIALRRGGEGVEAVTLEEMRAIIRAVLSEHESRADRYFAYAQVWEVAGYLQLCEDRGMPSAHATELRREIAALIPMLDPGHVEDEYVAVQLALARLDGLSELPAVVVDERMALPTRAEVQMGAEVIQASGQATAVSSASAVPTISVAGLAAARSGATAAPTIVVSSPGGGTPPPTPGGSSSPVTEVASRQPTFAEAGESGMLPALEAGRRSCWEHRHYQLQDGRWGAQVHVYEDDGGGVNVTPLYPPPGGGYFATPQEARAYETAMARWYFTVNAPSPSTPIASTGR